MPFKNEADRIAWQVEYDKNRRKSPEERARRTKEERERKLRLKEDHPEEFQERSARYLASRRVRRRQRRFEEPEVFILSRARSNAHQNGFEFSLTLDDIVIPKACPVLDIPLFFTPPSNDRESFSSRHPSIPSLDRIDSSKGYIKGNVWVISYRANVLKHDAILSELERIVSAWESINFFGIQSVVDSPSLPLKDRKFLLNKSKESAKKRGLDFDIDLSDIMVPEICPILGLPLKRGKGRRHHESPSLDRIDSSKGYVKGNVWVISWRANCIKSNATLQELKLLVSALRLKMEEIASKAA